MNDEICDLAFFVADKLQLRVNSLQEKPCF
jgi:hypothetical protein